MPEKSILSYCKFARINETMILGVPAGVPHSPGCRLRWICSARLQPTTLRECQAPYTQTIRLKISKAMSESGCFCMYCQLLGTGKLEDVLGADINRP
jgi:hypothetical protein